MKTAINYFGKKNWLGAFAVPWAVINDTALLASLPDRDFIGGFSEAVKVALLKSPEVFDRLCRDAGEDPPPRDGRRPADDPGVGRVPPRPHHPGRRPVRGREARPLDFGHWSAHKLEPMSRFAIRHGEAVAIGVAIDCVYSSLVHGLPRADADRVLRCLAQLGFTLDHPLLQDTDVLFEGLEEFRQHLGGRLTVTMLRAVGDPIDVHEVDEGRMRQAIEHVSRFRPTLEPAHGSNGSA